MVTALLVTSAATLLESAPFLVAGSVRGQHGRYRRMAPYLGCGCGTGPSARSLPAAVATWLVFGPAIACFRFVMATAIERTRTRASCERSPGLLVQLHATLPCAAASAALALIGSAIIPPHAAPVAMFAIGAVAAFIAAPCGVGSVAIAGVLRSISPALSLGFIFVAGTVDIRAWLNAHHDDDAHDVLAYLLCGAACAITAARGGAGLIHPALGWALWPAALCCGALAVAHRQRQRPYLVIAPAIMLAGCILVSDPPAYHATQTTLAGGFAGENLDFTGVATQTAGATTLVRYAITCCRADAAPIVVRLELRVPGLHGWVHARGTLVERTGLRLRVRSLQAIAEPADPFVYR